MLFREFAMFFSSQPEFLPRSELQNTSRSGWGSVQSTYVRDRTLVLFSSPTAIGLIGTMMDYSMASLSRITIKSDMSTLRPKL